MKHKNSHFAVGYWSSLRHGRAVPDQADIDPRALKRLLPTVFLLDAPRNGGFVYRLAGTAICERHGTELRGKDFLPRWDTASRGRLEALLRSALRERIPVCLTSIGATEDCRMVEIETVLMPIGSGQDAPTHFLAVSQILTEGVSLVGRPIAFERLVAGALIREDSSGQSMPLPSVAPASIPSADSRRSPAAAPHLRLIVSQTPQAASVAPVRENGTLRRIWALYGGNFPLGKR